MSSIEARNILVFLEIFKFLNCHYNDTGSFINMRHVDSVKEKEIAK